MKKIQNYNLEKQLGRGQFGIVYLARHRLTNQLFAAKVTPLRFLNKKLLQQLQSQINILNHANSPYITKLYKPMKTRNNLYMITEYCRGGDLQQYLQTNRVLDELLVKKWLIQLISAFMTLQQMRVIHRDIKLSNVLLTQNSPEGDIKVADFGFARELGSSSFADTQLGTPLYMAPEIFNMEHYSYKADVWSLGVMSYQMLTGDVPFKVKNLAQLKKAQKEPVQFPDELSLSEDAKDLVRKMLIYNHFQRPEFKDIQTHSFFLEEEEQVEFVLDQNQYQDLTLETDIQDLEQVNQEQVKVENQELGKKKSCLDFDFQMNEIEKVSEFYEEFVGESNYFGALGVAIFSKEMLDEILITVPQFSQNSQFQELIKKTQEKSEQYQKKIISATRNSPIGYTTSNYHHFKEIIAQSIFQICKIRIQSNQNPSIQQISNTIRLLKVANFLNPLNEQTLQLTQQANVIHLQLKSLQYSTNQPQVIQLYEFNHS